MKKILLLIVFAIVALHTQAQIRSVIVENYYVSDTLDATDTINWTTDTSYYFRQLPAGSKTYRVYVELDSGYKIKKIYGTPCHPLMFKSTADFFNNINRAPNPNFGRDVTRSWINSNPTMALDSWITLGYCAKQGTATKYLGVLKTEDTNGSLLANGGGTAGITGGILVNTDASAGIPIQTQDGMVTDTTTLGTWLDDGFRDAPGVAGVDTTSFGTVHVDSTFFSTTAYLQQNNGVHGISAASNKVLVAQLTTTGDLRFEINLELLDSAGASHNYVASNGSCALPTGDTIVSGVLKYPPDAPVCKCHDPAYVEYVDVAQCYSQDSCHHLIVYGCMDTLACNYDPNANYSLPGLCCYPGNCADRDLSLVCPDISGGGAFHLFPNPTSSTLTLQFSSSGNNDMHYAIYDSWGVTLIQNDLGVRSGSVTQDVDVSNLQSGIYLVRVFIGNTVQSATFMKQ